MTQASTTTTSSNTASSSEFVPTTGGGESTSANGLLVAAYMVLWVILLGFVALNWRRQRALSERLTEVERSLAVRGSAD